VPRRLLPVRPAAPRRHRSRIDVRSEHRAGGRYLPRLRSAARGFLAALDLSGVELSILLSTDAALRTLNRDWRRKDRPTDVLSFPAGDPLPGSTGPRPLGDVILSLDTARRAARAGRRPVSAELELYLAHGLLHLLGHDHHRPADARRMAALEDRLLGGQGMVHAALTGG
jgi:probable rRNA maturation factor